jgi:hypothetical protein
MVINKENVLALLAEGLSQKEVARRFDITIGRVSQIRSEDARKRMVDVVPREREVSPFYDKNLRQGVPSGGFTPDNIRELILPRFLAPRTPTPVTVTPTRTTIVYGDTHFPHEDNAALSILYKVHEELKPERSIGNGDITDLLPLSAYPRDYRIQASLLEEQEKALQHWNTLAGIGASWGIQLLETEANHSGNGRESRFARWISDNANSGMRAMLELPQVRAAFDYANLFHPNTAKVELVDNFIIADDLLITHGALARKGGGNTARAHSDAWLASVMHSHTHRAGTSHRRIPAMGSRAEGVIRSFEIGCMCNLNPSYGSISVPADWSNAFAIITEGDDKADYGVEIVSISNGRANVSALGKTIKA